jgi:hypothetical protein
MSINIPGSHQNWKLVVKKQTWLAKLPVDNHTIRFVKKSRTYLLTASNFGIVCKRKDTTLPDDLIKLLRAYKDLPVHKIPSIHHGQKYEQRLVDTVLRSISRLVEVMFL